MAAATNGDYVAHVIRSNGRPDQDAVQQWHIHECSFQMVYVLNGWATFQYADEGERTIRKGDCINQRPGIPHREIAISDDFEVLEGRCARGLPDGRGRSAGRKLNQDRDATPRSGSINRGADGAAHALASTDSTV